ncbi:glycosyltransferase family 4 protein [Zeaxanthinibacter sp. PT1]|uniref:glycosyltransferase family 4 protein n=1 Tax=Zeaxanthinibacter TaxID=561554 RepID=UPI00234A384F|nr:glycosyltransferase family 4 protein [Zeaxanthinibacter sp. PT1]MDC6351958.1 glycosyltransferase family 4 protein [Zeaxanthinibacter sp. PT1]
MKVAILSPIAWRTPPRQYGPWEQVASVLTEGLHQMGVDVTLFATADSVTAARLSAVCPAPYAEQPGMDPKVWECLHISNIMECAGDFDLIHNHFDFLPLTYSKLIRTPMLTTIHGFSSEKIVPVYQKYNDHTHYVSISDADRHASLTYERTIYHGLDPGDFPFCVHKKDYLLYFGRIHPDKGTHEAIAIARKAGMPLLIAGLVQDEAYYHSKVLPYLDDHQSIYLGNVGPEQRAKLLGEANALLHPISFEEPFGLSVAEALMCGTPVVAYHRGSMAELIRHGKTGFLVFDQEGAVEAIKNLHHISPIHCREDAMHRFGIETMIKAYMETYKAILSR